MRAAERSVPRPERQRDLGRYLPGFIAEGIEVFRRGGGESGLSGSSGFCVPGFGILTHPASSRIAEAANSAYLIGLVFMEQR